MNIVYASHVPIPSHRAYAVHVMHMCNAFTELGHNVTLYSMPGSDLNSNVHSYYGIKNKFNIKYNKTKIDQYINKNDQSQYLDDKTCELIEEKDYLIYKHFYS